MERFVHQRLRAMAMEQDGVSLIEMLAAILILGIALAAFASSMVSSLQAVSRDQRMVAANALATEVIEDLQGLAWEDAALYADEATAAFGGTAFEGEDLVLRSDDRDDTSCQPVPCPVRTVDRDGVPYEIRTAITWVDDEADNESGDDDTGDSDDYKRFTVDLSWTLRDTQRDHRVVALRTAESRERPIRVEVEDSDDDDDDVDLNGDACNSEPFTLSAETLEPAEDTNESVIAKYTPRYGDEATTVLLTHAGDYRTWSKLMEADTSEDDDCLHEKFQDGPVLFTFEAVDRATGMEVWRETEIVNFFRALDIASINVPASVQVDEVGNTCDAVTVTVDVDGGTTDDTVTFTWNEEPPASHELDTSDDETSAILTDAGARFEHTYPAGTPFGSPGDSKTLTVDVDPRLDRDAVSATSDSVDVSEGCDS